MAYLHLIQIVGILILNSVSSIPDVNVDDAVPVPADRSFNSVFPGDLYFTQVNHPEKTTEVSSLSGLEQLEELGLLSAALVEKAGSGSSPAHDFRIQARMYRELLRQTMLSDREKSPQEQLPQDLLLDMVRMSALLHSAADCKTGFVITCPADLMLQLKSQQAKVEQALKVARMLRE